MARRKTVGSGEKDDRMDGVETEAPAGYTLGQRRAMKDVLEVEAELLRSEGLDPAWPGFGELSDDEREANP
jgi:hypothetical protein